MAIYKILLCAGWLITLQVFGETKMDKIQSINGVTLESGKKDSTRIYRGSITKKFSYGINSVVKSIVNFQEKCNNSFKNRRQYTDKSIPCKYSNDNIIETIVVKDINKTGWTKTLNEIERYVLGRQIYNRASFSHYELVTIHESRNAQNNKIITINQRMMSNEETKKYTKPLFDRDSAFDEASSTFTLTEINSKETDLKYEYQGITEHWILNKEISIPQVFASISKSINDLVHTMDEESLLLTRDIASN
jgi:hypothetical protein